MIPLSCINCAYNGLQYDAIGTSVGYCAEHKRVLNTPSELTCGRQFRKDLTFASATHEQEQHALRYSPAVIASLWTRQPVNGAHISASHRDLTQLARDKVAAAVTQYGRLGTKIESLAQLSALGGARAEIALASLGRVYVRRCVQRAGKWTSGLHLFWWVSARLADDPEVAVNDLRGPLAIPLARQIELAKWSVVMLRLTLLSDIGVHAQPSGHSARQAGKLVERAAAATGVLSLARLLRWVRGEGTRIARAALPEREYERLSRELHAAEVD